MGINKLIGNTPVIKIKYKYNGKIDYVYAKLEYYNLTGSVKDRLAYYIINKAKKEGILKDNMPIIEATSGNTGISFAALGAYYKHPVHIFMPSHLSEERIKIMKQYGAIVHLVSKEEGGFQEAIRRADNLAKEINGFRPQQFDNIDNVMAHYNLTGKEIVSQVPNIGYFVSGIGTGGTLMGIGKRLKEVNKETKLCALEPAELPLLSQGKVISSHKIEGIGDDFIPSIVSKEMIDEFLEIKSDEAINMAKKISKELGIGVGISSGANFLAAVLLKEKTDKNVVTLFVDDNKKYLSTDLGKDIKYENFVSDKIKLIDIE